MSLGLKIKAINYLMANNIEIRQLKGVREMACTA